MGHCVHSYKNKSSAVAKMGDRGVATIDMGRKEGGGVPLSRELGPRLVQCGLGKFLHTGTSAEGPCDVRYEVQR